MHKFSNNASVLTVIVAVISVISAKVEHDCKSCLKPINWSEWFYNMSVSSTAMQPFIIYWLYLTLKQNDIIGNFLPKMKLSRYLKSLYLFCIFINKWKTHLYKSLIKKNNCQLLLFINKSSIRHLFVRLKSVRFHYSIIQQILFSREF